MLGGSKHAYEKRTSPVSPIHLSPSPPALLMPRPLTFDQPPKSGNLRRSRSLAAEQFIAAPANAKWILVSVWPTGGVLFDFGFSVLPIFVFVFGVCRCPKTSKYHFHFDSPRWGRATDEKAHRRLNIWVKESWESGRELEPHFGRRWEFAEFKNFTPSHNCLFLRWNAVRMLLQSECFSDSHSQFPASLKRSQSFV